MCTMPKEMCTRPSSCLQIQVSAPAESSGSILCDVVVEVTFCWRLSWFVVEENMKPNIIEQELSSSSSLLWTYGHEAESVLVVKKEKSIQEMLMVQVLVLVSPVAKLRIQFRTAGLSARVNFAPLYQCGHSFHELCSGHLLGVIHWTMCNRRNSQ